MRLESLAHLRTLTGYDEPETLESQDPSTCLAFPDAEHAAPGKLAGKYLRWIPPGETPQRITGNPAFAREHRLPEQVWKDPKIVAKSNCPACHQRAELGYYDGH